MNTFLNNILYDKSTTANITEQDANEAIWFDYFDYNDSVKYRGYGHYKMLVDQLIDTRDFTKRSREDVKKDLGEFNVSKDIGLLFDK